MWNTEQKCELLTTSMCIFSQLRINVYAAAYKPKFRMKQTEKGLNKFFLAPLAISRTKQVHH